jgi:acetylglutamate/LysW-gamma-L-alpha-aminoadipate kinase
MLLIKLGGGLDLNWEGFAADIKSVQTTEPVIVVHGASATRDRIAEQLGIPIKTVISPSNITSVYTDQEAMDVFLMAYAGLVNKKLVAKLQGCGINAVGLCGLDGALWQAEAKKDLIVKENGRNKLLRNNLSGRVTEVNTSLILLLLREKYLPVICPPALGAGGEALNTDNDLAAAVMAEKLGIHRMVSLFEAPGLLADPNDESSLISCLSPETLEIQMERVEGRMKKKVMGALRALRSGVQTIYWGDGRINNPILSALEGQGTVIQ